MAQNILIKRSSSTAAPSTLENGELAYSHVAGTGKLYIGRPGGETGDVDAIGGKAFTDKLDLIEAGANNYELADLNSDLAGGVGNIVTTGYLRGPSNFVIDPATHGNDTGTLTIAGDLVVNGTTTTVNSTEINLADNIINLNSTQDEGSLPPTSMVAGLQVDRGSAGYDAYIMWRELSDKWFVSFGGPYDYELLTAISELDGGTF